MTTSQNGARKSGTWLLLAILSLLVAAGASLALVLKHHGASGLPGCGPESACAELARSVWGSVPGLGLPTSHLGLAYFLAMLVAVALARGVPRSFRWVVWLGALVSVVLMMVMLTHRLCPYCLAVHAGNLAFVFAAMGLPALAAQRSRLFTRVFAGVGGAAFLILLILAIQHERGAAARAEQDFEASMQEAETRVAEQAEQASRTGADPSGEGATSAEPFTGRYRRGPDPAPIRLVIISDYQCPDCRVIENEVRRLLAGRDDVSFSAKHYPFCTACNDRAAELDFNPHPNACWAARAAEAAGMLEGDEGFWRMHEWLFDRRGGFTDAELDVGLAKLGFDRNRFIRLMTGPETLARVRADIAEAESLGLHFTPMIFVNGVEVRGWTVPNVLTRAVERLAATNPPALTAAADRPEAAIQKYVSDWASQGIRSLPHPGRAPFGDAEADAPVRVTAFGDYRDASNAELDALARLAALRDGDVAYVFRHFPLDQSCNIHAPQTRHPQACRAAQAAEAARIVGGADAFWAMHAWLMTRPETLDDAALSAAATEIGIDPDALLRTMGSPEVKAMMSDDIEVIQRIIDEIKVRSLPAVFVNGRYVPRWKLEGADVLDRIIEAARAQP